MITFQIIKAGGGSNLDMEACKCIIQHQGFNFTGDFDRLAAMRLSDGLVSPVNGFVIIVKEQNEDDVILLSYFDLVDYIKRKGLQLI